MKNLTVNRLPGKNESDLHRQSWQDNDYQVETAKQDLHRLEEILYQYSEENDIEIWGDELQSDHDDFPFMSCHDAYWVKSYGDGCYWVRALDTTGRPIRQWFKSDVQTIINLLVGLMYPYIEAPKIKQAG